MTEAEWLASNDPSAMLNFLASDHVSRALRCFGNRLLPRPLLFGRSGAPDD